MTFEEQYLAAVDDVLSTGIRAKNRTGTDTLYKQGLYIKIAMDDGFPLLTTKKVPWKSAIAEMLGFIRGYTSAADFRALGCKVWDANANENEAWLANPTRKGKDSIGLAYGPRWRNWHNWASISPIKKVAKPQQQPFFERVNEEQPIEFSKEKKVGLRLASENHGFFNVLGYIGDSLYKIQFEKTGYIKKVTTDLIKVDGKSNIRDPYYPSFAGFGYEGENVSYELRTILLPTWRNMLNRCYAPSQIDVKHHWYKNSWVDERWFSFENFVEDAQKIPGWELKKEFPDEYTLDKDYLGANFYAKQNCRWSTIQEQIINSSKCKSIKVTDPNGESFLAKGIPAIAEELNLVPCLIQNCLSETQNQANGYTFEYVDDFISYTKEDQLKKVYAKLCNGVDDRRLIISGWHPAEIELQCLPSCHMMMQFGLGEYVLDSCTSDARVLDLFLYIRSNDMGLGMPFNAAQYAWLLTVMAQITGHVPGILHYFAFNHHIYVNHIDALKEQLTRNPKMGPTLSIHPRCSDLKFLEKTTIPIGEWNIVHEYNPHSPIKMEMAV